MYYVRKRNVRIIYQPRDILEERDNSWKKKVLCGGVSRMGKTLSFMLVDESH